MSALNVAIAVVWAVFWLYWLASAIGVKQGTRAWRARPVAVIIVVLAAVVVRLLKPSSVSVHSSVLEAAGVILLLTGLGLAVWARLQLGRNWGPPMTKKDEPELVTSGPYRFVRHPIYSGILLGVLGTALATNIAWLVVFAVIGAYFFYSAWTEEKLMTAAFPAAYPTYRARTKMLIPFVL